MNYENIFTYKKARKVLEGTHWLFIIKSQDQSERRQKLLSSRKGGRFGRLQPRPTAAGLLVYGRLEESKVRVEWKKEFREPRHIKQIDNGEYLLTEINRVLRLDSDGNILGTYVHPFFGFLHTVDVRADGRRALIVSSGYDSIFELDLKTGQETFRWFAWDHGFNPDEEGLWLTADKDKYTTYCAEGKNTLLVDPGHYDEQGLVTARRSAHPNGAVYDIYTDSHSFIVSIGHSGNLYRISYPEGETSLISNSLSQMPHGLIATEDGWFITNTTCGEWWCMDTSFHVRTCYSIAHLGGKVEGTEDVEWLQQVVPVGTSHALFLDANRGLITIDRIKKCYSVYHPDPNWCIQDALFIS